ncbi:hypothetical protein BDN72DRAFT_125060 [Pluteus cervinus]|uniref:Uncharacterized protein n=1 Tax=Pluteus cervinus TaxID=181527 RepID=A0ACD3AMG5_9AGAR|nr:hypothetical protein BDN72DRAFT_125060 [Pluteus cervinus]
MTFLFYDYLITLDGEIGRIWILPWRLPKILFLINRYVVPPTLVFNVSVAFMYDVNPEVSICEVVRTWTTFPTALAMAVVQLALILRVQALYQQRRNITYFLWALFLANMISFLAISVVVIRGTSVVPGNELFSGCLYQAPSMFYVSWIPPLFFESVVIILTLYKIFDYRKETTVYPALRILARDSLIYFIVMFSFLMANLFLARFGGGFFKGMLIGPSSVIACVAVARMTMNLREFVPSSTGESISLDDRIHHHKDSSNNKEPPSPLSPQSYGNSGSFLTTARTELSLGETQDDYMAMGSAGGGGGGGQSTFSLFHSHSKTRDTVNHIHRTSVYP